MVGAGCHTLATVSSTVGLYLACIVDHERDLQHGVAVSCSAEMHPPATQGAVLVIGYGFPRLALTLMLILTLAGCDKGENFALQARNLTRQSIAHVNALYGNTFEGVNTVSLATSGVFPSRYVHSGRIIPPWGGSLTARPADNYGWLLIWKGVPPAVCTQLAEWYDPSVQDITVDGRAFAAGLLPLAPSTAQTLCSGSRHRVSFHIYAG